MVDLSENLKERKEEVHVDYVEQYFNKLKEKHNAGELMLSNSSQLTYHAFLDLKIDVESFLNQLKVVNDQIYFNDLKLNDLILDSIFENENLMFPIFNEGSVLLYSIACDWAVIPFDKQMNELNYFQYKTLRQLLNLEVFDMERTIKETLISEYIERLEEYLEILKRTKIDSEDLLFIIKEYKHCGPKTRLELIEHIESEKRRAEAFLHKIVSANFETA